MTVRSRLRFVDLIRQSWLEVVRRPGRTALTSTGVALGVAAIVTTLTLVPTIRFQVSDQFDARRATQVEVRSQNAPPFPLDDATLERLRSLRGVDGVASLRETMRPYPVAINQVVDPSRGTPEVRLHGIDTAGVDALELSVSGPGWSAWHEAGAERVVMLSAATATELGASDLAVGDRLFVAGVPFGVVGILDDSPRLGGLMNGLVMPITTLADFDVDRDRDRLVVVTRPGAANQVAALLPAAVDPLHPEAWTAYAPVDDETMRLAVDQEIQALALVLGATVLVIGAVSIGNATLGSVVQRIHEIGVRRALGARPRHIAAHVVLDSVAIGLVGSVMGVVAGTAVTLAVTAAQGWVPVIDPRLPGLAIGIGAVVGALAGLYPARVASRLQPTDALRRS